MLTRSVAVPKYWENLEFHPLSELTDFGAGVDVGSVADYMAERGYDPDYPITLWDGRILNGRLRFTAARQAGVVPTFVEFEGDWDEACQYVREKLMRQHLDKSQLAMFAARMLLLEKPSQPVRQPDNQPASQPDNEFAISMIDEVDDDGCPEHDFVNVPLEVVQLPSQLSSQPDIPSLPTIAEAAAQSGTSERQVYNAIKVLREAVPEISRAVSEGTVTVNDAKAVSSLPASEQREALRKVSGGEFRTLQAAVKGEGKGRSKAKGRKPKQAGENTSGQSGDQQQGSDSTTVRPGMHDDFGNPVPSGCRDAFGDKWLQEAFDRLARLAEDFRGYRFSDGMHKRAKAYPFIKSSDFIDGCGMVSSTLDHLVQHLKDNRPSGVCQKCKGKKCAVCRQSGMVPRSVYLKQKEEEEAG